MKQVSRYLFVFAIFMASIPTAFAQTPVIKSLDKTYATVKEVLTISGSGFGTDENNILVMFGAATGEVLELSDTSIKVKVPAGATYGSVSVLRLDSRLTAYSPKNFMLSHDGNTFDQSRLDGPYSFPSSGTGLYNNCICDFNMDGKVDIATSDIDDDKITVLENISPDINSVDFTQREFDVNTKTRWVRCGDLNGDGKPELVFSAASNASNSERIYIFENNSTVGGAISFALPSPAISYTADGTLSARMDIKDLDDDGKPEIVVVSISNGGGISVFKNISTGGVTKFNNIAILPFDQFGIDDEKISGIDLEDLDGDGKADIIVSEDEKSGVYIIKNSSAGGTISFDSYSTLSTSGLTTNMRSGDLNGDGKPEIIIINKDYVGVFKNNSVIGDISFDNAVRFDQIPLDGREGLELADLDGNGMLDITYSSSTDNRVVVLLNNSTSTSLNFNDKEVINRGEGIQSVRAADLNGDGLPDLAYTGVDSDEVHVLLNRNCIKPVLEPVNGLGVCDELPYQLSVTQGIALTYKWESSADGNTFTELAIATDSTITFTTENEAYYRVKISSSNNGFDCNEIVSNVVQVVRPDGFVPDKPTIIDKNPEEPFCYGDRVILRAQNVNARFFWEGPNGFVSNEQNPVIDNATKENEGLYVLYVKASEENGGCVSDTSSTYIKVSEPESINITSEDPLAIFEGGSAMLKVKEVSGSTYSWKKDGSTISGASNTTLTVSQVGTYVAVIRNETGCTKESAPIEVAYAEVDIPEDICLNETLDVSISPATLNGKEISYRWSFGDDAAPKSGATYSHTFSAAGEHTIKVEILNDSKQVKDNYTQEVEVIDIPSLSIETPDSPNLCPEATVKLLANEGFASYAWDNGESGTTITVNEPGEYILTAITEANCTETASITVVEADNPAAEITADADRISLGESIQLKVEENDEFTYAWSPAHTMDDSTVHNPEVRPLVTTTYTCIVTNKEGCQTSLSYTVNVDRSLDVEPDQAFTPNGDGRHDIWYVERMDLFPDCKLTLYDRLGSKLHEIENYSNANGWDGTINGKVMPEGVYFYLIDCGVEAGTKTGSITIIR